MIQNSEQQVVTPHGVSSATVGLVQARQVNSSRICTPKLRMSHESTSVGKQLEFAYRGVGPSEHLAATPVNLQHGTMCCVCQDRQVMVDRVSRNKSSLFHLLCFPCYHHQMERKRMIKQRRALAMLQRPTDTLSRHSGDTHPPEVTKYQHLAHRRHQAQILVRRALMQHASIKQAAVG